MYINFDCLWGTLPWQEGNHFTRWISRVRTSDPLTGRQIFPYPPNTSSILRGPVPSAATRAVLSGSGGSFGKGHYGASFLYPLLRIRRINDFVCLPLVCCGSVKLKLEN